MEFIRTEVADNIATVTMDRPPVNAQSVQFRKEIMTTFDGMTDRDDVRVVILASAGKVFSGGADIKERGTVTGKPGGYGRQNRLTREVGNAVRECEKPVIAAVNGPAMGAGLALMAACDIIVIADTAYVGMPEVNVGIAAGSALVNQMFGRFKARRMMFTGSRVSAADLHRMGIAEACVPLEQLMDEALSIAREIASKDGTTINFLKRNMNAIELMPRRDAQQFEQAMTMLMSRRAKSTAG
jgi:enoyl-CoA hydratase